MRLGIDLESSAICRRKSYRLIIGSRSCVVSRMAHVEKMDKAERNRLRAQIIRDRIKGGEKDV